MTPISTNRLRPLNESVPAEVSELLRCIESLPEEHRFAVEACADRIVEFAQRRRRILNLVQDALGQLRLDMKYLMFDLDATRRERDRFRRELDGQHPDD